MHVQMHVQMPVIAAAAGTATLPSVPGFEYRRATWDEVQALGPQGWRLVAIPPIQEVRNVLGAAQASEPMFTMERDASAACDQAVALRTSRSAVPQ